MVMQNNYINDNSLHIPSDSRSSSLKWYKITLSEVLKQGKRLDASVYNSDARQAQLLLTKGKFSTINLGGPGGLIQRAFYPSRFKRVYCSKGSGKDFFLPSQMMDICPKPEKFISKSSNCDFDQLKLQRGTLLLSRSGTIGPVAYVSRTLENKIFSDDVIRISFENSYDAGYVYTYLKTQTGNLLLTTNGYGSVITHIEPEHLDSIPIPNATTEIKKRINDLIEGSYALRDESNKLISEATSLLKEELHFTNFEDIQSNLYQQNASVETFNVKLTNLKNRVDASFHVPIVDSIVEHFGKYAQEITTIGDPQISEDVILPGRFKRIYVEREYGVKFLGGKEIYQLDPTSEKYLSLTKHKDRISDQLVLRENMILITCSGTVGKVCLTPKHWTGWTANQHIIRVTPACDQIAGYLYIYLSSEYAKPLITRFIYGSVVDEIDNNNIRQIPVPLLSNKSSQDTINKLALLANDKRYSAYLLEQKAIEIFEKEVLSIS